MSHVKSSSWSHITLKYSNQRYTYLFYGKKKEYELVSCWLVRIIKSTFVICVDSCLIVSSIQHSIHLTYLRPCGKFNWLKTNIFSSCTEKRWIFSQRNIVYSSNRKMNDMKVYIYYKHCWGLFYITSWYADKCLKSIQIKMSNW